MVKTTWVELPLTGTLPVPVQPMQANRTPLVESAGVFTLLVTVAPETIPLEP
jgi:hypothetical protein